MRKKVVAERIFSIASSPERIWRLLGKVIFSSLPEMENIEILDENNFRAILRTRLLGAEMSLKVKGEVIEISPLENLVVRLSLIGPGSILEIDQRVSFVIKPMGKGETTIICEATVDKIGRLSNALFMRQIKRFAQDTFSTIEKRLRDLA